MAPCYFASFVKHIYQGSLTTDLDEEDDDSDFSGEILRLEEFEWIQKEYL